MKWLSIFIGCVTGSIFGLTTLYELLIPDPCYYHTRVPNFFIDLLFSLNSGNNSHPEPNLLYILICASIGGVIGYKTHSLLNKISKNKQHKDLKK